MNAVRKFLIYSVSALLVPAAVAQQNLLSSVSFEDVQSVPFRQADDRIEYGAGEFQFGELWIPSESTDNPSPLVIMIHGGCWLNSFHISHTYAFNTALAELGFAVWALEYRRTGDDGGGWPGTYQDIRSALQSLDVLADYPVNTNRVAVLGHSAGGHLAVLAATDTALSGSFDLVVGLAAIVDIERYSLGSNSCQTATPLFMNGTAQQQPQDYAAANPVGKTLLSEVVLLHGDVDQIVPVSQAVLEGAESQVVQGAGHFDWIHPGTTAFAHLLALLKESL